MSNDEVPWQVILIDDADGDVLERLTAESKWYRDEVRALLPPCP